MKINKLVEQMREMEERDKKREEAMREMKEKEMFRERIMKEMEHEIREIKEKKNFMGEGPAPAPAPVAQWVEYGYVIKGKREQRVVTYKCIRCGRENIRTDKRESHVCKQKSIKIDTA
jgi:hypothetical protein